MTIQKGKIGRQDLKLWDGTSAYDFSRKTSTGGTINLALMGDFVDIYGLEHDRTSRAILNVISKIGSNKASIVLSPGTWNIADAITIPSNIGLIIPFGALPTKSSSGAITANGPFESGLYQVFSGFSAGDVTFGAGAVKEVFPAWWTTNTTPGTTNMTTAIQCALNAARSANRATIVNLGDPRHYISATVNLLDGVTLRASSKWYGGLITDQDITMISTNILSYCTVERLRITGPGIGTSQGILANTGSHRLHVRDVYLSDLLEGVAVWQDSALLENVRAVSCTRGIALKSAANATDIISPFIESCTTGIHIGQEGSCRQINVWGGVIQACAIGIFSNVNGKSVKVRGTYFEANTDLDISSSNPDLEVNGCTFVANATPAITSHISFDGPGAKIKNNNFIATTEPSSYAIASSSGAVEAQVLDNTFESGYTESNKYSLVGARSVIRERGVLRSKAFTFTADDATPSVAGGRLFVTANVNPTTITTFHDGVEGQEIIVKIGDAVTTIDFTGTNLKGNIGVDWTPTTGDFLKCTFDGSNWYCSVHDCTE